MFRTGDWSTVDLIKYLASIRKNLTDDEMKRLKHTQAFLAEESSAVADNKADGDISKAPLPVDRTRARFMVSDLFEPTDAHRSLGLPTFEWLSPQRWRNNTAEG